MIDRSSRDGVALLQMHHDPANALDVEFSDHIDSAIRGEFENRETTAIVLTGTDSVFSAGVDLFRLLDEGDDYLTVFLASLDRLFDAAYRCPKPLVAAVNGHAIAGGGILALACDYRVMGDGSAKIGLPELKVGVPFPRSALSVIQATVPVNHQREVILLGRNFGPSAALTRGLIDEIVPQEEVLPRALEVAGELAGIPPRTFALVKRMTRLPPTADIRAHDADVHAAWAHPETHEHMRGFLEKTLGKRSR